MYAFRTRHGPADLCFTDRYGGVSASPFDELNLAVTGEEDQAVGAPVGLEDLVRDPSQCPGDVGLVQHSARAHPAPFSA